MKNTNKIKNRNNLKQITALVKKDLYTIRWALAAILVFGGIMQAVFGSICPMRAITGLPCPGCGMTRAAISLLRGRWDLVLQYNVLVVFWIGFILYLLWMRYVRARRVRWEAPVILLGLGTIAYYIYRMCLFFPGIEPIAYHSKNVVDWLMKL